LGQIAEGKLGPVAPAQREMLLDCREASYRLLGDLTDMLTVYTSAGRPRVQQAKVMVDVNELLVQSIQSLKGFVDPRCSIAFQDNCGEALPLVFGSRMGLSHAFQNVIDNSLRHSSNRTVVIRTSVEPGFAKIQAENECSKPLPKDPFKSPLESSALRHGWSTRLGLYLTKQLVEEAGGSIAAGSLPSGNALFTILLPLAQAESSTS
jgi:signal transduction histidine kinase